MIRPKYKPYKYFLPVGIAQALEIYCSTNHVYKKPEVDYFKLLYIIDTLSIHLSTYISHTGKKFKDYKGCPLNLKILSSIIGSDKSVTSHYLKILMDLGIIKRIGSYEIGKSSSHYSLKRIPENYESVIGNEKYSKITDKIIAKRNFVYAEKSEKLKLYKKFLKKLKIFIEENENLKETVSNNYKFSNNIYSKYESSINQSQSTSTGLYCPMRSTFNGNDPQLLLRKRSRKTQKALFVSKYVLAERIIDANEKTLQAIIDGEWFVHRKHNKSRVYTNLTSLNRNLRPLLRYDGKPLVELDIRNSQPLIASILINNYWKKKRGTIPADVVQYQKDCEAGIFYDYFMTLNNIEVDDRPEFKITMFAEVFFSKVTRRTTKLKKQFIEKYPHVYEAICSIKGGLGSKDYNRFAISLQNMEAVIMFDDVLMGLLNDGIPAFNVFDGTYVLYEHKETARERIMMAFAKHGLTPTINYKNIPPQEAITDTINNNTMKHTTIELKPNSEKKLAIKMYNGWYLIDGILLKELPDPDMEVITNAEYQKEFEKRWERNH